MTQPSLLVYGGPIFDGSYLHKDKAARFENGVFQELLNATEVDLADTAIDLEGDILSPGFVDLQVNGGGGAMLNGAPSVETLTTIAQAHRRLGTVHLLPTLISDHPHVTQQAIDATKQAVAQSVNGIAGLHLEGPHLSISRKGAHDASVIRQMEDGDLADLLAAARSLPLLKITVAPESVSLDQVKRLTKAGVLVSLGHTDADFETCCAYFDSGAQCATHLFNAMSQLGSRSPGLVGAVLAKCEVSAGLIADGIHVHPATMRAAWHAKSGSGQIFLVSDAMAVAGTELSGFELNGRAITRSNGQLTLADGTLAGADLELVQAVSILVNSVGVKLSDALAAATSVPAGVAGISGFHMRSAGLKLSDAIRISPRLDRVSSIQCKP